MIKVIAIIRSLKTYHRHSLYCPFTDTAFFYKLKLCGDAVQRNNECAALRAKWTLEEKTAPGEDVEKIVEMTTKDLKYYVKSVDKGAWGLSVCVLSCFSCVWFFVTLWTVAPPGSSVYGILQATILERVAIPFSGGSSQPRDRRCISYVSCISRQVLGEDWVIMKETPLWENGIKEHYLQQRHHSWKQESLNVTNFIFFLILRSWHSHSTLQQPPPWSEAINTEVRFFNSEKNTTHQRQRWWLAIKYF